MIRAEGNGVSISIYYDNELFLKVYKDIITVVSDQYLELSVRDLDKINFIVQKYYYYLEKVKDHEETLKLEIENFNLLNKGV